jgi:hypothetical protein
MSEFGGLGARYSLRERVKPAIECARFTGVEANDGRLGLDGD